MIYLYSPTSTTKHIEVSTNFAGDDGMIITFSNQLSTMSASTMMCPFFFDCSWISRYPGEDERLFIHGHTTIDIEAVRIIESNTNYTTVFHSLRFLDFLLSVSKVSWIKIDGESVASKIIQETV